MDILEISMEIGDLIHIRLLAILNLTGNLSNLTKNVQYCIFFKPENDLKATLSE